MKPFLGIDLTENKKNEQFNGSCFLVSQPSSAMAQAIKNSTERAEATIEHAKLPAVLRIGQWVCGAVGAIVAAGILRGLGNVTLQEAYQNASWLFWLAGGCLLVWAILKIVSTQKEKAVLGTEESTHTLSNLDSTCSAVYSELSVPADAKEVDILSFFYKVKNGEIKVCEKGMQITPYFNPVFKIYSDSDHLYIANLEGKYAFPLSAISSIRTIKKHIRIPGWNKDEGYDKGIYKQYKLTADNYGCIHCKHYHILEINHNGQLWGIYFPCYELPVFESAAGLTAQ